MYCGSLVLCSATEQKQITNSTMLATILFFIRCRNLLIYRIMNLKKLGNIQKKIEEIKGIIDAKSKDFNLYAFTTEQIMLDDAENYEAHVVMNFIEFSISHGSGSNNKRRYIKVTESSVETFLLGFRYLAEKYISNDEFLKENFVSFVGDF